MRLEHLFKEFKHFMNGNTVFDKRAAISTLLDILMIFSRNNVKSVLLKELKRHSTILSQIADSHGVDSDKLKQILDELDIISRKLYETNGKIGSNVMESDLFKSIAQRSSIPGGTCSFDLPAFHYWLERDIDTQQQDFQRWTDPLLDINMAIDLILNFIRKSSLPSKELAEAGFFQLALDKTQSFQLLRIATEHSTQGFAEISGGKHRFTIRFMTPASDNSSPTQNSSDIPFLLTCCAF